MKRQQPLKRTLHKVDLSHYKKKDIRQCHEFLSPNNLTAFRVGWDVLITTHKDIEPTFIPMGDVAVCGVCGDVIYCHAWKLDEFKEWKTRRQDLNIYDDKRAYEARLEKYKNLCEQTGKNSQI